ncbi:glycosyltransferase [Thermosynechococcaceae cyanobacterium Okahandja]
MNTSVSIILTCYNLEAYIAEAIESVFQQTEKCIQLIIIDDCSTDSSPNIIERYYKIMAVNKSIEINYIKNEKNLGVMLSTLKALSLCKNDIVLFLDGDDIWHNTKVESVVKKFDDDSTVFVTHDVSYIDANSKKIRIQRPKSVQQLNNLTSKKSAKEISDIIRKGIVYHKDYVWLGSAFGINKSKIYLSEYIQLCLNFPKIELCYQDWPLAVWVACISSETHKFGYIPDCLMLYRLHSCNYSSDTTTLDKLTRNLYKSYYTARLIRKIVFKLSDNKSHKKSADILVRYSNYRIKTLKLQRIELIKYLLKNILLIISFPNSIKEITRLVLLFLFGADFLNTIKNIINKYIGTLLFSGR